MYMRVSPTRSELVKSKVQIPSIKLIYDYRDGYRIDCSGYQVSLTSSFKLILNNIFLNIVYIINSKSLLSNNP